MMKKLRRTKKEAWRVCQALWKELSITGFKDKRRTKVFSKFDIENDVNHCPLCTYVDGKSGGKLYINHYLNQNVCREFCPKDWPGGCCISGKSPYYYWDWRTNTISQNKELAKIIYKLPMKNIKIVGINNQLPIS